MPAARDTEAALIETLTNFGKVLDHRVKDFELNNGHTRRIERASVESLKELRRSIPPDQRIRVAGKLDLLKHSTRILLPCAPIAG